MPIFRTLTRSRFALICLIVLIGTQSRAQDTPLAIINARVITCAGPEIEKGALVVHKGRIVSVGAADKVSPPEGAAVLDAAGKVVMPGLVDTHSHIGGVGGADSSGPIQPEVRVLDSINPLDSGFRRAVAGGQTTLNVMPGSGHLLSGQTVYLKMRGGNSVEDLVIRDAPQRGEEQGRILGGIKMANGTNSIGSPPFLGTRAKSAALVRERFVKAREYKARLDAFAAKSKEDKDAQPPERDLALEALVEALDGTRIVHHHTHRADDILTVLRLQKEFGFRVVLHHTSEAWKVPSELRAAQDEGRLLGCSIILVDSPGGKLEAANLTMETGAVLERAGVRTCIHSDDWINDARLFLRCGAMAVRAGMSREGALRALTIDGARMLDLGDRIGSLEPGKDADFIILSGDPFRTTTRVEQTYVEGKKVFDLARAEDRLFATGGFGAGRDQEPYMCCAPTGGFTLFGKAWGP